MTEETMEVRIALLEAGLGRLITEMEARDKKIDELLTLKNKGMGALWFVSLIIGSSVLSAVALLVDWIRG